MSSNRSAAWEALPPAPVQPPVQVEPAAVEQPLQPALRWVDVDPAALVGHRCGLEPLVDPPHLLAHLSVRGVSSYWIHFAFPQMPLPLVPFSTITSSSGCRPKSDRGQLTLDDLFDEAPPRPDSRLLPLQPSGARRPSSTSQKDTSGRASMSITPTSFSVTHGGL